jgi:exodeoxyribonuclease VII small subunit
MRMARKPSRKPAAKPAGTESSPVPFEEALSELETIVEELEDGSLSLENALSRFERGIQLSKQLQKQLTAAEARVRKLVGREGGEPILEEMSGASGAGEPTDDQEDEDDDLEEKGNPTLPF